jgi:hypothetical protein
MSQTGRTKKLHISSLSRSISIEERLRFSRLSREQALLLSPEDKLRYFYSLRVSHAKLRELEERIERYIGPFTDTRILTLIGPPGAGKTSFAEHVLANRLKPTDIGQRPFVLVSIPAHGSNKVPWSAVYTSILEAGDEPLIQFKRTCVLDGDRVKTYGSSVKTLSGLRSAVESMLRNRATRVLALDEILHLVRFGDPAPLMDTFKSLVDATDCQLLLVGGYDLLKMVTAYAQVARRSEVFYLGRYCRYGITETGRKIENTKDIKEFRSIIHRLQGRWPLEWVPDFSAITSDLMDVTLGIVGLLKELLMQCLIRQVENGGRWKSEFLERSIKPASVVKAIGEELRKGEEEFATLGVGELPVDNEIVSRMSALGAWDGKMNADETFETA